MRYQALLFCPDDKTARVVTQVLSELEFQVDKKLMAQHFDAIVVDCENEQNASLLFKSARNSGSNASALSVAVVEGAFRIGANLVLTRPINVEQSKGTLRVARGLLRKAEAAKPVATAPDPSTRIAEPSAAQPFTSAPSVMPSGPSHQVPIPTASASGFELQAEPDVKPDAAEATLLEYMPDVPTSPAQTVSSHAPKEFPWQPISKHGRPYQLAGPRQLRRPPKKLRIRRSYLLKASRSGPPGLRPISRSTAPAGGRGRKLQFFHRSQELKRSKNPVLEGQRGNSCLCC